jgi:tRNA A37 threonylcarbamoyladenosine synthetase subunit TsaC/SUA5/YrdC
VPDHPVALKLLQASGPLAVTSANLSGEVEARDASGVLAGLEGKIEMIVDGGLTPGGLPSTVIDCTSWPAVILRQGPISHEQIFSELDGV